MPMTIFKDAMFVIVLVIVVPALVALGVNGLLDNECHDTAPLPVECSGVCA